MQGDVPMWLLNIVIFCKRLGHGFCCVPTFASSRGLALPFC